MYFPFCISEQEIFIIAIGPTLWWQELRPRAKIHCKYDIPPQYFCLVFQYKYLNVLKSRYIFLRSQIT